MAILTDAQYDEDIQMAIDDSPATFTLTVPDPGSPAFDPTTGISTPSTEFEDVTGIREDVTSREVEQGHGRFAYGDKLFFIKADDLTLTPDTRSTITDSSVIFNLIQAELDPTKRLWILIGREV